VRRVAAFAGVLAALSGCGDGEAQTTPADRVRLAARAYLGALEARDWPRTCRLLATSTRRDIEGATGSPCERALAGGAALPPDQAASARREVAGAGVQIRGATAVVGPIGALPQPLRLRRVGRHWLISG
jgi:hypothetical protein